MVLPKPDEEYPANKKIIAETTMVMAGTFIRLIIV